MKRVFIDSSVFFSAAYSEKGASRELLLMGARGEVILVLSSLVLEETRRNLSEVSPDLAMLFDIIVDAIPYVCSKTVDLGWRAAHTFSPSFPTTASSF